MDATIATVLIDNTRSFAKRMSSISTTETTSLERFKSFTIFSRRWLWKKWVCDFQLSSSIRKSDIGQAVPYVGRYTSKFCRSEEWNSTGRNLYSIWGASKIQSSERLWWIAVEQPSSTWSFPSPNVKRRFRDSARAVCVSFRDWATWLVAGKHGCRGKQRRDHDANQVYTCGANWRSQKLAVLQLSESKATDLEFNHTPWKIHNCGKGAIARTHTQHSESIESWSRWLHRCWKDKEWEQNYSCQGYVFSRRGNRCEHRLWQFKLLQICEEFQGQAAKKSFSSRIQWLSCKA